MLLRLRNRFSAPYFEDETRRARANIINVVSLAALLVGTTVSLMSLYFTGLEGVSSLLTRAVPALLVTGGAQLLLRLRRVEVAGSLLVVGSGLAITANVVTGSGASSSTAGLFLVVIMLAGMLLGVRAAVAATGLVLSLLGVLSALEERGVLFYEPQAYGGWLSTVAGISIGSILLYLFLQNLSRALRSLQESNRELQATQAQLEERIAERTRDLALAAEVGRRISQVRDLDRLLNSAVMLIQARFDLYYAQVYLIDESGRNLVLRAGTGTLGRRLVQRRHQLPIGPGSINGTAASGREAVVVPDTSSSPLFRPNPLLPQTRSEMAVPLIVSDRVVGVLDLQSDRLQGLTTNNLPAFAALAGQLAVAIENAFLFADLTEAQREVEAQTRRLTRAGWDEYLDAIERGETLAYSYVDGELSTQVEVDHVLSQAGAATAIAVPIQIAGETLGEIRIEQAEEGGWDEDAEVLVQTIAGRVAQQVENLRLLEDAQRYQLAAEEAARRLTREAWQEELALLPDSLAYLYDGRLVRPEGEVEAGVPAGEAFPLAVQGEAIGELRVENLNGEDAGSAEIAAAVAGRLSAHLENLRLAQQRELALREAEKRTAELTLLNRIVSELSSALDLHENLRLVARELALAITVDQCGIALLNEERTHLTVVAEYLGETGNPSGLGAVIPVSGNPSTERVLETRETLVVVDAQNNPLTEPVHELFRTRGISTVILMPILINNEVIGTVGLDIIGPERQPTREELQLAETIVFQVATFIENARLYSASQERAEELAVINEVARVVSRQIEPDELLRTIHENIGAVMKADAFVVSTFDEARNLISYPYIFDHGRRYEQAPRPPKNHSLAYQVIQSGEPLLLNRTPEEVAQLEEQEARNPTELTIGAQDIPPSALFVPLTVGTGVTGTMSVQSYEYNAYTEKDLALLSGIANHVAVALENARLFAQAQQRAHREQLVNAISEKIQRTSTVEGALRTAVEELGRALQVRQAEVALVPAKAVDGEAESNGAGNGRS